MLRKESLRGMHGIYVVVEDLGPELKGVLTRSELRKRVENATSDCGYPPSQGTRGGQIAR